MSTGVVVRSTGTWVDVRVGSELVRSRVRGRMRLENDRETQPLAVGDEVSLRVESDGTGLITRVHDRRNYLSRRAAGRSVGKEQVLVSNIDMVWIVQSTKLPNPNPGLIDRVLVTAEAQQIPAGIVFNKMDLAFGDTLDRVYDLRDRYARLGYRILLTSALVREGIDDLRAALAKHVSIFTGPSGVGKSSLLNALEPELALRAGNVSQKTRKGRHTTAHAILVSLASGGSVVDTPGIREFGVLALEAWELSHYFPEFLRHNSKCRYTPCTHHHEPGCAVKDAAESGYITPERYRSYLNILHSISRGIADTGR